MSNTNSLPTLDDNQLSATTGGVTARWLGNHPYAGQAFLAHHPVRAAEFSANHPWMANRITRIAGAF